MWPMILMGASMAAKTYGEAQAASAQQQEARRQQREAERFNLENIKAGERLLSEQAQPTATAQETADLQRSLILAGRGGQTPATVATAQRISALEGPAVAARRNAAVTQELTGVREDLAMRHRFATMLDWIKMRLAGQKGSTFRNVGGLLMSMGQMGYAANATKTPSDSAATWGSEAGATDATRSNDEYQPA